MRQRLKPILCHALFLGASFTSSHAVTGPASEETTGFSTQEAVRQMGEDLGAFTDGSWFRRLLQETSGAAPAGRVAYIRRQVLSSFDRHDETFRRLPAAWQEELLRSMRVILEGFQPIRPADEADAARVIGPLESWRRGYRAHLMARNTKAWESRTETLLRLLRTLRLLPDGGNVFDGSLQVGCVRYVHERYASIGDRAIKDAQLILLHEFERFEQAVEELTVEQMFDLWRRWRRQRETTDRPPLPRTPLGARVDGSSFRELYHWTLERARQTEERLRRALQPRAQELRDSRPLPESISPRLASILERIHPDALHAEARRWWDHWTHTEQAFPLQEYSEIVRSVHRRRTEEAALRAASLDETERGLLKRELWLQELEQTEENDR